jgi:hypothetical protein
MKEKAAYGTWFEAGAVNNPWKCDVRPHSRARCGASKHMDRPSSIVKNSCRSFNRPMQSACRCCAGAMGRSVSGIAQHLARSRAQMKFSSDGNSECCMLHQTSSTQRHLLPKQQLFNTDVVEVRVFALQSLGDCRSTLEGCICSKALHVTVVRQRMNPSITSRYGNQAFECRRLYLTSLRNPRLPLLHRLYESLP